MDWSKATIEEIQEQLPNRIPNYLEHKMKNIKSGIEELEDWLDRHKCVECGVESKEIDGYAGDPRKSFCSEECITKYFDRMNSRPKDRYKQCTTCFNEAVSPFDPTQVTDVACMAEGHTVYEKDCPDWNKKVRWRR